MEISNEAISIIVPVYNVEKYLNECLNSIIKQTYKNLEIMLIDDGSSDRSGTICDDYAALDSRISVIHQKNGGVAAARNAGLNKSTGEFIGFVDSDDYISGDFIQKMVSAIRRYECDIVICGCLLIDESGIPQKKKVIPEDAPLVLNGHEVFEEIILKLNNAVWNKLYRKQCIGETRFPDGTIHGEDFIFNLQCASKARKTVVISNTHYFYRMRQNSITHSKFSEKRLYEISVKDYVYKYVIINSPEYSTVAKKHCFKARTSVYRSLTAWGKKIDYQDQYDKCYEYMVQNYASVKKYCNVYEKLEFFVIRYMKVIYPIVLKITKKS